MPTNTFREIDHKPIFWEYVGLFHRCEGAEVQRGITLIWTLCQRDVPANMAFKSSDCVATCPKCLEVS